MSHATPEQQAAALDAILGRAPVLPVLTIERLEDAVPLARALVGAGLPVLEVTLRTSVALEAIARIALEVPDAIVGAGTILRPLDLEQVAEAGADFAISPGATDALYAAARTTAIPFLPAIATAGELMHGIERGHQRFKFFPAVAMGGPAALKALAGPFPQVRFCPTGGIDAGSAPAYLALSNVLTVGGAWMVPGAAVAARDWERIAGLARAAAALRR
ncbi:MAG TPA: bifunctional 4-hydroxy-2-oxoglutarate aldolase/2-dehydro-3-deoxy-phosphogluconate aldolase [Xanthomonadaceae bacterium]|nr:bifunctional 4-hydroxy-2-oxoglutarate aldolase/2-dehydro-3-deoxy-phosphogluconate aldolase [Xanthomonadaceae bacterium]